MVTDVEDQCRSRPPALVLWGGNALKSSCLKGMTQRDSLLLLGLSKQQEEGLIQINTFCMYITHVCDEVISHHTLLRSHFLFLSLNLCPLKVPSSLYLGQARGKSRRR